jgi:two-component system nitrate/nitrite response regulator NarL
MNPISIIIADDHEFLLSGLVNCFKNEPQFNIVASVANGYELLTAVKNHLPDVVLTDIKMSILDGVEATRAIKSQYPHIKVLALSAYDEHCLISDMIAVKADGYLLKNVNPNILLEAIHSVVAGKPYYCSHISTRVKYILEENAPKPVKNIAFTPREIDVLVLMAKGTSSKNIGKALNIGVRTVETYRQNIYKKTGLKSVVQIAFYAQRHGYLK